MAVGFGKVILLGEHAVVHGRPALAAALQRGAEARTVAAEGPELEVATWELLLRAHGERDPGPHAMLQSAFEALLEAYEPPPALRVQVELSLPGGAGLGGSAALSVAVVRALDAALGLTRSDDEVAEMAQRAERVFHGNPSGIDAAMAAHGGVCRFERATGVRTVRPARPLPLVVGYSGEQGSTKQTVASVARQFEREPERVGEIFDAITAVVQNGQRAIEEGELDRLGQLMILNQKLLSSLLLSTPRLEEMCQAACEAGAYGAKLTGGGGGGCMIALCEGPEVSAKVAAAIEAQGREAFITEAGA
ncbi:MAG: mevalonate kinase [Myxococcales bacterium]|nr:mevalonate kinase [Myxococcales bacterium]